LFGRYEAVEPLVIAAFTSMLALLLNSGGMAAGAILELGDPFFAMFIFNLHRIVLVAAITGVGLQAVRVANPALAQSTFSMIDRESMRLIKLGRGPGLIGMAGGAAWGE
jgi:hypothetical protein